MCKDGQCGHIESLLDEQQQFARLDPVMLTGEKLKIAVDAQHKIDRYTQQRHEEHESFVERLHKAVKSKEIKLSEAVRQTEEYAETSEESYKREIERYMLALDRALEGTPLAGLYSKSWEDKLENEDALPQVQHDLRMAEKFGIGIFHRHPRVVDGDDDEGEVFISGDVPASMRELGEKLAEAVGGKLGGIIAVPRKRN
jgi:hypothetical protein